MVGVLFIVGQAERASTSTASKKEHQHSLSSSSPQMGQVQAVFAVPYPVQLLMLLVIHKLLVPAAVPAAVLCG